MDVVAAHLGRLRRADATVRGDLDSEARRQVRRQRLNNRTAALTTQSSSRWANAIIAADNDQYRLAAATVIGRRAQGHEGQ